MHTLKQTQIIYDCLSTNDSNRQEPIALSRKNTTTLTDKLCRIHFQQNDYYVLNELRNRKISIK